MSRTQLHPEQVAQLPLTHEETIPEDYLDVMGHMNVMWYTHLFSMSMSSVMRLMGVTREYMVEQHGGIFALESHIRYLSEVRDGHRVAVHSRFLGRSAKRIHLIHFLLNHDKGDVAATFEMISTHVDMRIRRTSPFPEAIAEQIDRLISEHAQLDWAPPVCGVMQP